MRCASLVLLGVAPPCGVEARLARPRFGAVPHIAKIGADQATLGDGRCTDMVGTR